MKKTLVLLAVASCVIVTGLFCGLFTHDWIHDDGYSFGVLWYCNKTDGTSCQDITNVYTGNKDWLLACRYLSIVACGFGGLIFIFSFLAICCVKTSFQSYLRISIVLFFLESGLEAASIAIFLLKVKTTLSSDSQEIGYSLIVEFVVLSITGIVLLVLIITPLFCEKLCLGDLAVGLADSELRFRIPPGDVSVNVGEDVSVTAEIENADQVEWYKGKDRVIKYSTDHSEEFDRLTGHAQLTIAAARMLYDEGEYTCLATKSVKKKKSEIRQNFFVYVLPVEPVFLEELKNVAVHVGEQIRLDAKVHQAEMITWYHNDTMIPPKTSKSKKMLFRYGKASLIIHSATYDDGGEYVCCAKSGGSPENQKSATSVCEVAVHTDLPPSFEDIPSDQKVAVGGTIEISVTVKGFPRPPNVSWFKDEEELQMSRRINMQYSGGVARLKIYKSSTADSGIYECYAKNDNGNNVCRISVQIVNRQPATVECPICMDRQPNAVLECGHAFCRECIQNVNDRCPTCRTTLVREPSNLYL